MKRVKATLDRWVAPCGMNMWQDVTFQYHRDTPSMTDAVGEAWISPEDRRCAGRTVVEWRYKQALVHFNLAVMCNMTDEEMDYIVRHEIAHVVLNEMREWAHGNKVGIKHEERVATELAMIFGWLYMAGRDEGRRLKAKRRR